MNRKVFLFGALGSTLTSGCGGSNSSSRPTSALQTLSYTPLAFPQNFIARDLNNSDTVVGGEYRPHDDPDSSRQSIPVPALWKQGTVTYPKLLPGTNAGTILCINNRGQLFGTSDYIDMNPYDVIYDTLHYCFWESESAEPVVCATLSPTYIRGFFYSSDKAQLNDAGVIFSNLGPPWSIFSSVTLQALSVDEGLGSIHGWVGPANLLAERVNPDSQTSFAAEFLLDGSIRYLDRPIAREHRHIYATHQEGWIVASRQGDVGLELRDPTGHWVPLPYASQDNHIGYPYASIHRVNRLGEVLLSLNIGDNERAYHLWSQSKGDRLIATGDFSLFSYGIFGINDRNVILGAKGLNIPQF